MRQQSATTSQWMCAHPSLATAAACSCANSARTMRSQSSAGGSGAAAAGASAVTASASAGAGLHCCAWTCRTGLPACCSLTASSKDGPSRRHCCRTLIHASPSSSSSKSTRNSPLRGFGMKGVSTLRARSCNSTLQAYPMPGCPQQPGHSTSSHLARRKLPHPRWAVRWPPSRVVRVVTPVRVNFEM